ncbi:MAG: hypothetical protein K2Q01_02490, partial [Rickettsiales bacterium]|nr:hypothetical protein [Rickettsiales bacterium]
HPASASRLGFLTRGDIVSNYQASFTALQERLPASGKARTLLADFLLAKGITTTRLHEALPECFAAAKDDAAMRQAVGLMAHTLFIEPVARASAERLLHLAKHYEQEKNPNLEAVTKAYSGLYASVLSSEKALVNEDYQTLEQQLHSMDMQLRSSAPHLLDYVKKATVIYQGPLATREQQEAKALYHLAMGESPVAPPASGRPGR